ncbi:MAG: hypothetical protein JKY86_00055 [Gammaproteobacteria bacterium]|nr:hypothetical protein [Gammaproteobacteria bacterium]
MTSDTASPALQDAELRETLDLLSTVIASVSDRVVSQGDLLDRLTKTAAETRQAAFAARSQTDPELYGEIIAETVQSQTKGALERIVKAGILLTNETEKTALVLEQAKEDKWALLRDVRDREEKADRLKHLLPWFVAGAVVLALGLTVLLPRFLASSPAICTVLGADWTRTTSGVDACVFYYR